MKSDVGHMGVLFLLSGAVNVTKGEPLVCPASPTSNRHFCGRCGSPLFSERHTRGMTGLTEGSFDEPYIFKPQMRRRVDGAMAWPIIHDDAPRHLKKPKGMTPPVEYDPLAGQTHPPEPEQAGPEK